MWCVLEVWVGVHNHPTLDDPRVHPHSVGGQRGMEVCEGPGAGTEVPGDKRKREIFINCR